MSEPTPEQRDIIENPSGCRIRVVSAVPGSGKTWVVARAIEHELGTGPALNTGLAALSFTNVAKQAVVDALGGRVPAKHFVGTLDAFLYRFVVRVFLPSIMPCEATWRLMPQRVASNLNSDDFQHVIRRNDKVHAKVNLFDCTLFQGRVLAHYPWNGQPIDLSVAEAKAIRDRKIKAWRRHGLLSHGDAAYLAARLLESSKHGPIVRDFLASRFPFIVLDELQDTGESHGRCLRSILADSRFRALLVGDPDQSIYEFSGASPSDFDSFVDLEGSSSFPLSESRRCPAQVCRVASHLSEAGREVRSSKGAEDGNVTCVIYDDATDVADMLSSLPHDARVVVRKNATLGQFSGRIASPTGKLGSRHLAILRRAVIRLFEGSVREAVSIASHALSDAAFEVKSVMNDDALRRRGSSRRALRVQSARLLFEVAPAEGESYLEWGKRARTSLKEAALRLSGNCRKRIQGPGAKTSGTWTRSNGKPWLAAEASTVHAAKGETHQTTVFFVPKSGPSTCPSAQWWGGGEEQRVAFVACSRASQSLVLALHRENYERLEADRNGFLKLFAVRTAEDWIEELRSLAAGRHAAARSTQPNEHTP